MKDQETPEREQGKEREQKYIEFLKHHSGFYGELFDHIDQLGKVTFNGRELFEYCESHTRHGIRER